MPAPPVNAGDVIMILVEDYNANQTSFTLELSNAPGSAQTGPPDATITPVGPFCTTDGPVQLTAVDNGGTWSGTGVSPTGVFDPSSVAAGTYTIDYTIGSAPCDDNASTTITVDDCVVTIPCPDYSNTPNAASEACGNQLFDFEVPINSCPGILTFDVIGNYGSDWASEITWDVVSNLTGNVVSSGGPGADGANISSVVNVDPNLEGTIFTMTVYDSYGDGFNGTGGYFQIEQGGAIISGPVTGDFGSSSANIFGANLEVSSSTLTITTPSGNITNVASNCLDHDVQFTLDNTNFCTPVLVNLPWEIVCDETGAIINSGTHAVTVYPQIPTQASDLVTVSWNTGTCQWDVLAQNDCDLLDIGSIFNITPDPFAWPTNTCSSANQDFTIDYLGVSGGPDCCSTGGPLGPIQYSASTVVGDASVQDSPFGGVSNSAYITIPANGTGGNATALTLDVDMSGYCFDPPGTANDDYWLTVFVDGIIVHDVMYTTPPTGFNESFTLADIPGYNENSVVEVYIYPNSFNASGVNTTYVPGGNCAGLNDGEWTVTDINVSLDVTFTEQTQQPANCSFTEASAYTCCTVTPLTASNPTTINVECSADVPAVDPLVVTDEAGPCNPIVTFLSESTDGLSCPETITRVYRISNDCGDVIDVQQLIVIEDITAPVMDPAPVDIVVNCIGDIPAMINLGWTDNCDGTGTVVGSDSPLSGSCPATITRTWTYTDLCGNTSSTQQLITVDDSTPPTGTAPGDISLTTGDPIPAADPLLITNEADNCTANPVAAWVGDVSDNGNCPETITRTYSITDDCGNETLVTQLITIDDNVPPTASDPLPMNFECIGDVPAADVSVVTDEVDNAGVPTVTLDSESSDGLSCPETITRVYKVADACGNFILVSQIITVDDITAPTAGNPTAISIAGGTPVPGPDINDVPGVSDNCTASPMVSWVSDVSDNGTCPEIITRTYSVIDDCGNETLVTQTITIGDPIMPTASNPLPISVECIGDVPAPDPLVVTDEADNGDVPVVTFESDASDGLSCPETITRTYRVTDDCANFIFVTQTITVEDVTAPVIDPAPADVTVSCVGDIPAMVDLPWSDNCDGTGTVTGVDGAIVGSCPATMTRTWTYTDACGNAVSTSQVVTIHDLIPPVLDAPPAVANVQCIGDVPAMIDLGWTDNCDGTGVVAGVDVSDGLSCPETITRTWTYTDVCGNTASQSQIIIVHDTQVPVFANVPADLTVQCSSDVPAMANVTWTDNCDGTGVVAGVDVSDNGMCPETITRTWTYTDFCGNTAVVSQTITVDDSTLPTASNPAPIAVPGANDVPAPDVTVVIDEADNCTANPVVAWVSDVSDGNVCNNEKITRTYSVTDDCGNQITVTQEITILAAPAPIDAGPDQVVCSGNTVSTVLSNPLGVPVTWLPSDPTVGVSPAVTTTYTVTADNLGCLSTDEVVVAVDQAPDVSFTANTLSGCAPLSVGFANTSTSASGFESCIWTINGQDIPSCGGVNYLFSFPGTYDITLTTTSTYGCVSSVTYEDYIYVEAIPSASFVPSQTELSTFYTDVIFDNTSVGATTYSWDFGDNTAGSTDMNPTHVFPNEGDGSYVVELFAYSSLGCVDSAFAVINVKEDVIFYVPNSFTPDGDDFNEYFQPVFTSGYDPFDFSMLIFNRWGEIVWESHDVTVGWDGSYGADSGIPIEDGSYVWKIEFKTTATDERIMVTGHVTVVR